MCQCGKANDDACKKTENKPGATKGCEAGKGGGVVWEKQEGATDEDLAKAKQQWEDAKKRRLPEGSKPKTVEAMEALENSDKTTTIKVGPEGNSASPDSRSDSQDGTGSEGTIKYNPNKTGTYGDGVDRDPESSLAHEAYHTYEYTQGSSGDTREKREVSAAAAENEHREAKGLPQRQKYGAWDIPQYTP